MDSHFIENILRYLGDIVFEASGEGLIKKVWVRDDELYPDLENRYTGRNVLDFNNKELGQYALKSIEIALKNDKSEYIEYTSTTNEEVINYAIRIIPDYRQADAILIIVENISSRQVDVLVEDKWKLALDATGDGVWDAYPDKDEVFFSDKWYELLGYKKGETANKLSYWANKVHPDDVISSRKKLDDYVQGKTPYYSAEMRYLSKDGEYKWILSRGIILSKNKERGITRFIGTHQNIQQRKIAEEELKLSVETFKSAFKYSGVGMALVSPEGKFLEVNNALTKIVGYSDTELLQLTFQDITYPDDLESDLALVHKMLLKEIETYTLEKRYITKQSKIVTVLLTVSLVWNNDNSPHFFISQVSDITNDKLLVNEVKVKNTSLETLLATLSNKINKLEELNNIIAHNLRGPVNNMNLLIRSLKGNLNKTVETDVNEMILEGFSNEELIDLLFESNKSLTQNLDTLMKISQINLNKNILFENCDVEKIVNAIIHQLYGIIYEKQVSIGLDLKVPVISYPKMYLESILYNFISNAIKYARSNVTPQITVATAIENNQTILSVKDNGLGIDLEKYSEKLFKLNETFHEGFDSKGVGLFITKSQVEALGGSIEVQSKVNEGSTFIVKII